MQKKLGIENKVLGTTCGSFQEREAYSFNSGYKINFQKRKGTQGATELGF